VSKSKVKKLNDTERACPETLLGARAPCSSFFAKFENKHLQVFKKKIITALQGTEPSLKDKSAKQLPKNKNRL
jgi:hypothetical protein